MNNNSPKGNTGLSEQPWSPQKKQKQTRSESRHEDNVIHFGKFYPKS